ncbi:hypothetical protein ACYATP_07910 [Lactobacillaceae bacterium Melli_B4]
MKSNLFKSIFKLSILIKVILVIVVIAITRFSYNSVADALVQNYQSNNSTINRQLPNAEQKQRKLATELTNAKHERIITKYHYDNAFSKKNSKDKTLKKWINKKQKIEDKVANLSNQHNQATKNVNHLKSTYISKENIHNAHFNLTSIAIVIAAVIIFFILGF